MIITQTPLRIPLLGGGTDLPIFYKKYGGQVLSVTINKYVYVIIKKNFKGGIRFSGYYNKEIVSRISKLKHRLIKAIFQNFKEFKNLNNIEIISLSDLPGNTGLGSSSSFAVGLLKALYGYIGKNINNENLAKSALYVERIILNEYGGCQDQYIASYGGIKNIKIQKKGLIKIEDFKINKSTLNNINKCLLLFDTNIKRYSKNVHKKNLSKIKKKISYLNNLLKISKMTKKGNRFLQNNDIQNFGKLMNEHWENKKKYGHKISSNRVDHCYQEGLNMGAYGGKIIGAGAGGYLALITKEKNKKQIINRFNKLGFNFLDYSFVMDGCKTIVQIPDI